MSHVVTLSICNQYVFCLVLNLGSFLYLPFLFDFLISEYKFGFNSLGILIRSFLNLGQNDIYASFDMDIFDLVFWTIKSLLLKIRPMKMIT